jgi:putative DNA primase/helicase
MSDALDLIDRANDDAEKLARYFLGEPSKRLSTSRELRWGDTGKFALTLEGQYAGKWTRHGTGEHGDALDLIQAEKSLDRLAALQWLRSEWFGDAPLPLIDQGKRTADREKAEVAHQEEAVQKKRRAAEIWRASAPIRDTIGHQYLVGRLCGYRVPDVVLNGGSLRWNGSERMEGAVGAMVALMTDPESGKPSGIHRTYVTAAAANLKAHGTSMRLMLGQKGVVRLWPDEGVTIGLSIGEGIETTLAGALLMDRAPAWAALDAGNMGAFPVLSGIETITVLTDNDKSQTGQRAAATCEDNWSSRGREATVLTPPIIGMDFADFLQSLKAEAAA